LLDSDVEEINDALQGCLTYQPSVPTRDIDIVLFSEQVRNFDNAEDTFIIDRTVGKDVKFQLDYTDARKIEDITVTGPGFDGSLQFTPDDQTNFFSASLGDLQVRNT
jgi:hypothetical protein